MVNSSPAVAAHAEGEEIEVLESTDVLPVAPEDQWKSLFDKYDPENSGFISTERFRDLLVAHGSELDPHKLEVLLALADGNADGKICYQDFVNLVSSADELEMSNKRSNSFRRAILQGSRQLRNSALREEVGLGLSRRLVRYVAYETLPREVDRKWYFDSYTYCPPPWLMLAITIAEVIVFMYYGFQLNRWVLQVSSPYFLKGPLPYHPQLRAQAWRYLSYIFMHAGIEHLGLNMAMQLLVGVPLEMVHGALRIGLVYVCGVLAGSLAVSVADMTAPVVGSSGGVYALVSAHLANVVMNWSGMKCQFKLFRMAMALVCMSVEFGRAVWLRFYPPAFPPCPNPSFVAHLGGVAVGLTLGVVVLQNYEQRLQEQSLFWIFFSVYTLFILCGIFWNIFAYSLLDVKLPPPP
ncbi:rhomboid-related protein 3 [Sinocyclocheilus anshuiensis]|uniref:rhomboid protease n=1 Tax=Sinocyclocheilus anshuiensis TaxID=1608454 RepID=A0A671KT51_9TELE|nr:PREDICTED: rhomboid-related protein 3-like [Sinocyclocheilus anshuiensis]